ncbi:MAG: arylesterase, partial [Gammaproteobacteria bacterium]|nr:arylesterase [Gammaproteobacteria bacterium]
ERYGIPLIDFFLDDLYDRPGMLMDDGIHPSIEAQPLLADIMEPVVRKMMGTK